MNDTPMDPAADAEARRQQAVVAALMGQAPTDAARLHERGERQQRGLSAYRANAQTIAERALAAAYPTTAALIGAEDFAAIARALWRAEPPRHGDLAQWGQGLPAFLEAQDSLQPWPYLGDVARLDRAVAQCEAAADAALARDSLALLAQAELPALHLDLHPSVRLLDSRWPLAVIWSAHRAPEAAAWAAMRAAIDTAIGAAFGAGVDENEPAPPREALVVARAGWRAELTALSPADQAWMRAIDQGLALDRALDAAQSSGDFDVTTWLVQALQHGWLWRARLAPAANPEPTHDTDLA